METIDEGQSDEDFFTIYQLDQKKSTWPIVITISIENQNIPVEIDTGASISLIIWETFKKINCRFNIILAPTSCKLKTYSDKIVNPKGQYKIEFHYENKKLKTVFDYWWKITKCVGERYFGKAEIKLGEYI